MMVYTSSIERLRSLPDYFNIDTLAQLTGMQRDQARVYATRWSELKLIQPAGPRAGIYFNTIKNPNAKGEYFHDVVNSIYPEALLSAESVLHSAGWITQIPALVQLNVPLRRSYLSLNGCEISGRPKSWFNTVKDFTVEHLEADFSTFGFKSLHPAMALADMFKSTSAWKPDPDDIEIPDEEVINVINAFKALNVDLPVNYDIDVNHPEKQRPVFAR